MNALYHLDRNRSRQVNTKTLGYHVNIETFRAALSGRQDQGRAVGSAGMFYPTFTAGTENFAYSGLRGWMWG